MLFGGIVTGILLSIIAAFLMYVFYEYGKRVGYEKGLENSKRIFANFKANELEYVPKKDLANYLDNCFLDDEGNEVPDWYPILIVKPDSMSSEMNIRLKGE